MQFSTKGMIGKITARTVYYIHDVDIDPDSEREEVDEQVIAFVVTTPCPTFINCPKCSDETHDIRFERTEEPDIAALYMRLCVTEMITPESPRVSATIRRRGLPASRHRRLTARHTDLQDSIADRYIHR